MSPVKKFRVSLALLVSAAFACLLLMLGLYLWNSKLEALQKNFLEKSKEKAMLLKNLVIDELEAEHRVLVAEAMNQIVKDQLNKPEDIYIREAFFLSPQGNVIAHSNAMRMSTEMQSDYKKSKYHKVLSQDKENSILAQASKHRETSLGSILNYGRDSLPLFAYFLSYFAPEKIVSEYSIAAACYSPNSSEPISSLHLRTEIELRNSLLNPWHYYQVHYSYLIIFFALLLTCFLFIGHYAPSLLNWKLSSRKTASPYSILPPSRYGEPSPVLPPSPQAGPPPYPHYGYHVGYYLPPMPTAEAIPLSESHSTNPHS